MLLLILIYVLISILEDFQKKKEKEKISQKTKPTIIRLKEGNFPLINYSRDIQFPEIGKPFFSI